jgi:hypothetical protein
MALFFIKSQLNGRVLDVEDGSTEVRVHTKTVYEIANLKRSNFRTVLVSLSIAKRVVMIV